MSISSTIASTSRHGSLAAHPSRRRGRWRSLLRWLPRITTPANATQSLANGYEQLAQNARESRRPIDAATHAACAISLRH